jgi:hypothetical protein
MKQLFIFSLLSLLFLTGCSENNDPAAPVYKGTEQVLGNGKAYSWVKFSTTNIPTSIGFTLTSLKERWIICLTAAWHWS